MKTITKSILHYLNEGKTVETGFSTVSGIGNDQHKHGYEIDKYGKGKTTSIESVNETKINSHVHTISNFAFDSVGEHTHAIAERDGKTVINESKESRDLMRKMNLVYVGYGIYKDNQGNKYEYNPLNKQMKKLTLDTKVKYSDKMIDKAEGKKAKEIAKLDDKAEIIKELMAQYNWSRSKWIEMKGSDKGFDEWFTKQVKGNKIDNVETKNNSKNLETVEIGGINYRAYKFNSDKSANDFMEKNKGRGVIKSTDSNVWVAKNTDMGEKISKNTEFKNDFDTKLEKFRKKLEDETMERLKKNGMSEVVLHSYKTIVKKGSKYTKVNQGSYGRFMVDNKTGDIYGIKAYNVINKKHYYGTLDTIDDYYWGDHYVSKIKK